MMKSIDQIALAELSAAAAAAVRRRTNLNFHQSHNDPIQRMFNALAADTYVRPHRHPGLWELFAHIRGDAVLLTFDNEGRVTGRMDLGSGKVKALEVPAGAWHSVVALSDDAVIMEIKTGPYVPTATDDFAPWSPPEGTPTVAAMIEWMKHAIPGDLVPAKEKDS